jgi:hypothetical protein
MRFLLLLLLLLSLFAVAVSYDCRQYLRWLCSLLDGIAAFCPFGLDSEVMEHTPDTVVIAVVVATSIAVAATSIAVAFLLLLLLLSQGLSFSTGLRPFLGRWPRFIRAFREHSPRASGTKCLERPRSWQGLISTS